MIGYYLEGKIKFDWKWPSCGWVNTII